MADEVLEGFALLFEFDTLADVTGNRGCPNNRTAAILDRGNGYGNVHMAPVLAHTYCFVGFYILSPLNMLHDLRKFRLAIGWEEECDRLTYDLSLTITVHAFCGRIPTGDDAREIFPYNSVMR